MMTDAARTEQAGQGNKEMDKENNQIAHRRIVAGGNPKEIWAKQQFASHRIPFSLNNGEIPL